MNWLDHVEFWLVGAVAFLLLWGVDQHQGLVSRVTLREAASPASPAPQRNLEMDRASWVTTGTVTVDRASWITVGTAIIDSPEQVSIDAPCVRQWK